MTVRKQSRSNTIKFFLPSTWCWKQCSDGFDFLHGTGRHLFCARAMWKWVYNVADIGDGVLYQLKHTLYDVFNNLVWTESYYPWCYFLNYGDYTTRWASSYVKSLACQISMYRNRKRRPSRFFEKNVSATARSRGSYILSIYPWPRKASVPWGCFFLDFPLRWLRVFSLFYAHR